MIATIFSTAYFAPIQYYWHWNRCELPIVELHEHYIKQTWRNRCIIGTANGAMTLSLPVECNDGKIPIKDVRLSDHGNWQHLHWNSIESAYNSSPFFEFYEDDLKPYFEKKTEFLLDFNEGIRHTICSLLDLKAIPQWSENYIREQDVPNGWQDFRNTIHPKKACEQIDPDFIARPYYQVFDRKFGFQPNLSILDLLFNMGPESILYL